MFKKSLLYIIIFTIILIIIGTATFLYIYWPRTVELFETSIPVNTTILDLTGCPIDTSKEWIYNLDKFKNLRIIKCTDTTIPKEEKNELEETYPNIYFDIVPTIDILGLTIREDEEILDLSNLEMELDTSIDSSIIDLLKQLPKLKKVNLLNQRLNQQLQFDLIEAYPNIEFIWNIEIADKFVENNVEKLELKNAKINDIDSFKNALNLFPNLNYLDMSGCNLSNEDLANLREEFPNIKIVWTIYLGKWKLQTDAVAFSVLITQFDYVRMKSEDIEVLKYCTDLQALDLGHQAITDISIIGDYLPNLRILILADNKITDISPLSKLKHLHYLELFINRITDLTPLTECKELVDLNLCYNTSANITPLINNDFPMLERLWLIRCNTSYTNYKLLKEKHPNATIVYTGAGSTNDGWRTHDRYYAMINMFNKKNYISELFTKYDT